MSELQELVRRLQRWRRAAVLLPIVGLLFIGGLGWYARVQRARATAADLLATEAGKREAIWKEQAEDADRAAAFSEEKVQQHEAVIRELQARLDRIPRPPAPRPAPAEDAPLAAGLVEAGMVHGLQVLQQVPGPEGQNRPSTLGAFDARLAWTWKEAALRLPPVESRLEATSALNEALTRQVGAVQDQAAQLATARDAWKRATGACDERAEALAKETRALQRSLRAERWQKWAMVGGAAVVGFYAGRK